MVPVVKIALHSAVAGAPTVSVFMSVPVVPVTVNVLAPLLIDGAVMAPQPIVPAFEIGFVCILSPLVLN